jgi:hypothetical protein
LSHVLAASPLRLFGADFVPADDPVWDTNDANAIGHRLLWESSANAGQILFLSRLPNIALSLLLAAFAYRWARKLFGAFASVLALLLCAFDPNLLAHANLATADLPVTAFIFIAVYWLWRMLRRPTVRHLFATGVFMGLAIATKFSALLFVPILLVLFFARAFSDRPYQLEMRLPFVASVSGETRGGRLAWLAASGVLIAAIAVLTMWVAYGFQVGEVGGIRVLAPDYWRQLSKAPNPFEVSDERHFFQGELHTERQWPYFLVAFLLKTPLPTLILLAIAILISLTTRQFRRSSVICIVPPFYFLAFGLFSQVTSGYRYILPVVPFYLVYASSVARLVEKWLRGEGMFAGSLSTYGLLVAVLGWYVFGTAGVYPHYLAYFNEIAGGPENGWRSLVGDDLDRGQGLKDLKLWMERRDVTRIKLAYQGVADPAFYGIEFDRLPAPHDDWESRYSFYPEQPSPGIYAISANSLQGLGLSEPDTFAWFRQRQPLSKVGYALFAYEVLPSTERQTVVSLSGLRPQEIAVEDFRTLFDTNNLQFKWFSADRAFIFSGQAQGDLTYLIAGEGAGLLHEPREALGSLWKPLHIGMFTARHGAPYSATSVTAQAGQVAEAVLAQNADALLWWSPAVTFLPGDPAAHGERIVLPVRFGDRVELLGYTAYAGRVEPGQAWQLVSWWRVTGTDSTPLKVFAHVIDDKSVLIGGDDRLDVATDGWQAGDVFYQVHRIVVSEDALPATYQVELGWYDARTIRRLDVYVSGFAVADRVLLEPIEIVEGGGKE